MEPLTVRALMSQPVIVVAPHTRLPKLKSLMREHHIRRLPVVKGTEVVGIITMGDVRNAFPSDATTLSIYELSYLLDKVIATDVMRTEVLTIAVQAPVIEAARLMLQHKVSGLPVLEQGRLVGILTESDIFRAVVAGQLALLTTVAVVTKPVPPTAIPPMPPV